LRNFAKRVAVRPGCRAFERRLPIRKREQAPALQRLRAVWASPSTIGLAWRHHNDASRYLDSDFGFSSLRISVYIGTMRSAPRDLPPLILASASPRRTELLRQLEVDFKVVTSDVAEVHDENLTAREVSQINAYRKARAVAKRHPDALVLGADTLVSLENVLLGKPANLEEAYQMLEQLQGHAHEVVTAVCLLHLRNHRQRVFAESTTVTFRPLDAAKIRRYLTRVNPLDKAGAYAIQEDGDLLVERVAGSYSNVVGLPLERLNVELGAWAAH